MDKIVIEETTKKVEFDMKEEAKGLARRIICFYFCRYSNFACDIIEIFVPNGRLFMDKDEFPSFYEELRKQLDKEVSEML